MHRNVVHTQAWKTDYGLHAQESTFLALSMEAAGEAIYEARLCN